MYIQKHLLDIKLIKKYLSDNEDSTNSNLHNSFTRKEFVRNTSSTNYYFKEMLNSGLIIDTGMVYANKRGSPVVYRLNEVFLQAGQKETYSLTKEDIELLLKVKSSNLKNISEEINIMKKRVESLQSEHTSLIALKKKTL
jgi:hypothetical protein